MLELVEQHGDALEKALGQPLGKLLGCGGFGCVFASEPPWVVKLTCDPFEGQMWQRWLELQQKSRDLIRGTPLVVRVLRVHGAGCDPAFAVIREGLEFKPAVREEFAGMRVGEWEAGTLWWLDRSKYLDLYEAVTDYSSMAEDFHNYERALLRDPRDELVREERDQALGWLFSITATMGDIASETRGLAHALDYLADAGIPPIDVYPRNLGYRSDDTFGPKGLVLFDPSNTRGGRAPPEAHHVKGP